MIDYDFTVPEEALVTEHGDNLADQVGYDAYGGGGNLTLADVHKILDAIHTNFMFAGKPNEFLSRWMDELREMNQEIDTW